MKSFTPVTGFRACFVPSHDGLRITLPRRLSGLSTNFAFRFFFGHSVESVQSASLLHLRTACYCYLLPEIANKVRQSCQNGSFSAICA